MHELAYDANHLAAGRLRLNISKARVAESWMPDFLDAVTAQGVQKGDRRASFLLSHQPMLVQKLTGDERDLATRLTANRNTWPAGKVLAKIVDTYARSRLG